MSYQYGPNKVTQNLILEYDPANYFSYNGIGSTIQDISGTGSVATINNVTFSTNNLGIISLNGTNSSLIASTSLISLQTNVTLNAWVFLNSLGTATIMVNWRSY